MKNMRRRGIVVYLLPLLAASLTAVFFLSCAGLAQAVATAGQATGILNEKQAEAIAKTGVAWEKAYEEITPEQEYYIGRAVAANILAAYKLQNNTPALVSYVNRICNALVINTPRPDIFSGYHVSILDTDEINAFATPGGHILITRGLIKCAVSEDTLAAVIAHEVAHIQLQHGLMAIKDSRQTQAKMELLNAGATLLTNKELDEITGVFGVGVKDIVNSLMNGYSQKQEFDADSTALAFLELAGYEPSSLIDMLKVLERNQSGRPGGFNSTHPTPAKRIENAQKTLSNYSVPDTRSYREARYRAAM